MSAVQQMDAALDGYCTQQDRLKYLPAIIAAFRLTLSSSAP